MRDVCVTGTSGLVTGEQTVALQRLLAGADRVRHGMCQGADETAHVLACMLDIPVEGHPGVDQYGEPRKRMKGKSSAPYAKIHSAEWFLTRNEYMVRRCTELIAILSKASPYFYRSGEWNTINSALALRKPVMLVYPDGRVVRKEAW